jgi:hypothetical protein
MNYGVTTPIKSNARVTRSALALHSQRRALKKEIPMEKIDYKKQLKHLYAPSAKKVEVVEVPQMNFLMVDGEGDPNTSKAFGDAIEALYSLSYTLKFMVKEKMSVDYGVLPLEAIWWADDMSAFSTGNKDAWKWTAMIMQPEFITPSMVEEATEAVRRKKNPVSLPLVRFEAFQEGRAAQILHVGPFSEEGPTIEKALLPFPLVPYDLPIGKRDDALGMFGYFGRMGDENQRGLALAVQLNEQVDDAGTVLRVEIAGRLVGKDDLGAIDQRSADGDPLFLAARELVWEICCAAP